MGLAVTCISLFTGPFRVNSLAPPTAARGVCAVLGSSRSFAAGRTRDSGTAQCASAATQTRTSTTRRARSSRRVVGRAIAVGKIGDHCPMSALSAVDYSRTRPKFDQDNIEYEYDDDADKTMWCKCAAFAITCAPLFIILDVTASVIPFFQGKNYEKSCCQGCPGFKDKVTLRQPQASKAPASKEMERT